jgi:hypothetical protein
VPPGPFARSGARPDDPILVDSVAQIEPRAHREDCPDCGASLRVLEQRAETIAGRPLRVVVVECGTCGALPVRYYALAAARSALM